MTTTERYPLDFDSLHKGDVIQAERLVGIFGIETTDARFSGRQIELCERIEHEMDHRGQEVTVICIKNEIHILDDIAALEYAPKLFDSGHRRCRRAHRKLMAIDSGNLSASQGKTLDRAQEVSGKILLAMSRAKRELSPIAYERKTPGLPKPKEPAV